MSIDYFACKLDSLRNESSPSMWSDVFKKIELFRDLRDYYLTMPPDFSQDALDKMMSGKPNSFECLQQLAEESDPNDEKALDTQHRLIETINESIVDSLAITLLHPETIDQWMRFFLLVAARKVPESAQHDVGITARPQLIWWRCKMAALELLVKVLRICCNSKHLSQEMQRQRNTQADCEFLNSLPLDSSNQPNWILQRYRHSLAEICSNLVTELSQNYYVAPQVMSLALTCVELICDRLSPSDKLRIIQKVLFPLKRLSTMKYSQAMSNPREPFVQSNLITVCQKTEQQVEGLLSRLLQTNQSTVQGLIVFANDILKNDRSKPEAIAASLSLLWAARKFIEENQHDFSSKLLKCHLIPALKSNSEVVRCCACSLLKRDAHLGLSPQVEKLLVKITASDIETQVRVKAVLCLGASTYQRTSSLKDPLTDLLRSILQRTSGRILDAKCRLHLIWILQILQCYPNESYATIMQRAPKLQLIFKTAQCVNQEEIMLLIIKILERIVDLDPFKSPKDTNPPRQSARASTLPKYVDATKQICKEMKNSTVNNNGTTSKPTASNISSPTRPATSPASSIPRSNSSVSGPRSPRPRQASLDTTASTTSSSQVQDSHRLDVANLIKAILENEAPPTNELQLATLSLIETFTKKPNEFADIILDLLAKFLKFQVKEQTRTEQDRPNFLPWLDASFQLIAQATFNILDQNEHIFSSNPQYFDKIFEICKSVLTKGSDQANEFLHFRYSHEAKSYACKLAEVTLLKLNPTSHSSSKMVSQKFITLALDIFNCEFDCSRLRRSSQVPTDQREEIYAASSQSQVLKAAETDQRRFRSQLLQILLAGFINNPDCTVECFRKVEDDAKLQSGSIMRKFFQLIIYEGAICEDIFWPQHEIRMIIRGVCAIIDLPYSLRRDCADEVAGQLLLFILSVFGKLHKNYEDHLSGCGYSQRNGHSESQYLKWVPKYERKFGTELDSTEYFAKDIVLIRDSLERADKLDPNWYRRLNNKLGMMQLRLLADLYKYADRELKTKKWWTFFISDSVKLGSERNTQQPSLVSRLMANL